MSGNLPLIHLFFLVTNLWSLICAGAPTSLVYVYRGEARSPAEIQRAGGFLPKGQSAFGAIAPDISLFNHAKAVLDGSSRDDYGYVFTSSSPDIAERFISARPTAYVYKIHVAANMIDCIGTLGNDNPSDNNREYAALGGIKFEQIMSWKIYENGKFGEEEVNMEFNEKVYATAAAGGVQSQLAGFLESNGGCEGQPGNSGHISKRRFGFGLGSLKSGFGALKGVKKVKSISNVFKSNPFKKGSKTSPLGSGPQAPVKSGPGRKMPDLDPTPAPPVNQGLPADKSPMDNTPATKTPVVDKTPDNAPGEKTPVDKTPVDKTPVDKTPVDKTPSQAAPSVKPDTDGIPGQQSGGMRQGPDDQVPTDGTNGRLGGIGGSGMPIAINPFPAAGFPMSPFPMTPFPSTTGTDTTMNTPVDSTPVDGTTTDSTSTDGTLADGTSADGTSTDGMTVDSTTPVDGMPVPTTSTTAFDGTPVEDTTVQETPAHDVPTQKAPGSDTPVKDTPTKDTPTNDVPAKDTPVKETHTKGTPGKDTPVLDTPVSQLQARQAQTCTSLKSAYEIAKAYLASVNM